jgi:hypothetical protein
MADAPDLFEAISTQRALNRYGPTNRRPVEDVTFDERWGRRWEARP